MGNVVRGIVAAGIAGWIASFASPALAQKLVKQEPPLGNLKPGTVFLVDDGSCGPGQIKKVVIGNHSAAPGGMGNTLRQRSCVPRK
jgi:hypothetical protein